MRGDVSGHLGQRHNQSPESTAGEQKQTATKSANILAQLALAFIHFLRHRRKHVGEFAQTIGSSGNVLKSEFGRVELARFEGSGSSRQLGNLPKIFLFYVPEPLLFDAG